MKVGIVRGPFLNEWEMQTFEKLHEFNVSPVGIAAEDNRYEINFGFPVKKLKRFGQMNKIPLVSQGFQYFFPYNNYLLGFKETVKELDILHTAETFHTFSLQCVKSGKPTVVTVWENLPFVNERGRYKRFKKEVISKAQHFIAISQKAKEALEIEGAGPEKISVIPGGIDIETFRPAEKDSALLKEYGISKDDAVILFAGRLVIEKGILDLVYVLKDLKDLIKTHLLVVGSGPLKKKITKLAKYLQVSERITLIEGIEYAQMPKIHNLADVFCLPSIPTQKWEEQLGYVLLEAMACEKPVVSTFSGSIPEVVGDEGILIHPGDRKELYEALYELSSDAEKRKKMGMGGRKWVRDNFSAINIAEKVSCVYKSLGD